MCAIEYTDAPITEQPRTRVSPIQRVLKLLPDAKSHGNWYNTNCPSHQDSSASFGFIEAQDGSIRFKCFAGCEREHILSSLNLTEDDLRGNGKRSRRPQPGISLFELAVAKLIHPKYLASLGITDGYTWTTTKGKKVENVIRIPYYLSDGTEHSLVRIRTSLTAKEGSKCEGNGKEIPYFLNRLEVAHNEGYIIIPEGESDCWTLGQCDMPVLGLPGGTSESCLHADMLQGIDRVYVIQEPDDAGSKFPSRVVKRLAETGYKGTCYAVNLKEAHNAKDPNALLQNLFTEGVAVADRNNVFKAKMQSALEKASIIETHTDTSEAQPTMESLQPLVLDAIEKEDGEALYKLAEQIAILPPIDKRVLCDLIRSQMRSCDRFSTRSFNASLKEAEEKIKRDARAEKAKVSNRAEILLGRQLYEEVDDSLNALYKANIPPVFFVRSGNIVRCKTDENGSHAIQDVNEHILIERLTRIADYMTYNEQKDTYANVHPTMRIAHTILARGTWNMPPIVGMTAVPIIREDGSICRVPGYDERSRYLYIPQPGLEIPEIPDSPNFRQVEDAKNFLLGFIGDFPYTSDADRANAMAATITVATRPLYQMDIPMGLVKAKKAGTGKSKLISFLSIVHSGKEVPITTAPREKDDDEWAKVLTGFAKEGATFINFDNVDGTLNSAQLAAFLTAASKGGWKHRLLGQDDNTTFPQKSIVFANGNNIQIGKDIPRRCYQISMDAKVSRPDQREINYKYYPLEKHAKENRGKIIAAILTLARAWYAAGQPSPIKPLAHLGDFSEWVRIVGGILDYAGITGFLGNAEQMHEEADVDGAAWYEFLAACRDIYGTNDILVSDLITKMDSTHTNIIELLPDDLADLKKNQSKAFHRALGTAFRAKDGTPFGEDSLQLRKTGKSKARALVWCLQWEVKPTPAPDKSEENGNESNPKMSQNESPIPQETFENDFFSKDANADDTDNTHDENKNKKNHFHNTMGGESDSTDSFSPFDSLPADMAVLREKLEAQSQSMGRDPFWKEVSGQPKEWENGNQEPAEWVRRFTILLSSSDPFTVMNAREELDVKLGRA